MNHLTKGFAIRGIIFISIVIGVAAWMMFGDIPDGIYWTFIISINITYHTMEYIIRLRRERDMYKTSTKALLEISTDLANGIEGAFKNDRVSHFLDKHLSKYDDVEDLT